VPELVTDRESQLPKRERLHGQWILCLSMIVLGSGQPARAGKTFFEARHHQFDSGRFTSNRRGSRPGE
jgi:hypothetical protein